MSEQTVSDVRPPSIPEIQAARRRLEPHVLTTPTWHWQSDRTQRIFGARTEVHLKLLSRTSTTVMRLDDRLRVTPAPPLFADLKQLLGPGCLGQ